MRSLNFYILKLNKQYEKLFIFCFLIVLLVGVKSGFGQVSNSAKGVKPSPGKWKAIISNGFKGDVLTFTVNNDSKRIENVEFVGYWRASGRTEILVDEDPPGTFAIADGQFSEIKKVEKARMWWEFSGKFNSSTSAQGTYRVAYSGGASDTYLLKWEAKKIGN